MPATPILPTPDFTFDPNVPSSSIAACGPFATYPTGSTARPRRPFIVHNYVTRAGITLSWLRARVRDIVEPMWQPRTTPTSPCSASA